MTLNELIQHCEDRSGQNDPNYRTRWKLYINTALREHARVQPWPGLEDEFTLTATSRFLILPHYVDAIVSILDIEKHGPVERSGDWDRRWPVTFSQGTTGRVYEFDHLGEVPTIREPSGHLWFQSTNTSDVTSVFITGLVNQSGASGTAMERAYKTVSATSSGTTPVTVSTLFQKVISISKATDTNGDLFFYDAGAANAYASILTAHKHQAAFKRLQLRFVPDTPTDLRIRFRHEAPELRDDNQSTPPGVQRDFVIEHALGLHYQEIEQFSRAQAQFAQARGVVDSAGNKEENFGEGYSRIIPQYESSDDPDSDHFSGWF